MIKTIISLFFLTVFAFGQYDYSLEDINPSSEYFNENIPMGSSIKTSTQTPGTGGYVQYYDNYGWSGTLSTYLSQLSEGSEFMVMFTTDIEFNHPGIEGIITFEAGVFYDIIIPNFIFFRDFY